MSNFFDNATQGNRIFRTAALLIAAYKPALRYESAVSSGTCNFQVADNPPDERIALIADANGDPFTGPSESPG
jgi:hypothetical protein